MSLWRFLRCSTLQVTAPPCFFNNTSLYIFLSKSELSIKGCEHLTYLTINDVIHKRKTSLYRNCYLKALQSNHLKSEPNASFPLIDLAEHSGQLAEMPPACRDVFQSVLYYSKYDAIKTCSTINEC